RRWGGGMGMSTTTVDNYKVGTLIIELFDGTSKNLIWRGSASNTLSNNADKNIKSLDKNVQKMFEQFPPQPKKSLGHDNVALPQTFSRPGLLHSWCHSACGDYPARRRGR